MKKIALILALSISALSFGCATQTSHQGNWLSWPQMTQLNNEVQAAIADMAAGELQKADARLTPELRANDPAAAYIHAEIAALRGDTAAAIDSFLDAIAVNPSHSLVPAALVRINGLVDSTVQRLNVEKISALRVTDPYAKAYLTVLQSKAIRDVDTDYLSHPTAMPVTRMHWVGPFTPFVQTGFMDDQPFDSDPILAESYEVNGRKLQQYQYPAENITAMAARIAGVYAGETRIYNDAKREVQLTVLGAQLYTIYVDGVPVLTRDVSNFGQDSLLASTFTLDKGEHLIRIKLGLTPTAGSLRQISLWLSGAGSSKDSVEQALAGITELDELSGSLPSGKGVKNIVRIDTATMLGNTITAVPDDAFRTWLASMIAVHAGKTQVADALLQAELNAHPEDIVARYWSAIRYRKDADIESSVRNENVMNILGDVSENAPEMAIAHKILCTEFIKQGQPKKALELWQKNKSYIHEDNADNANLISQIASALSWTEIAQTYTLKAAELAPNSCSLNKKAIEINAQNHAFVAYDSLSDELQACPAIIRDFASREGDQPAEYRKDAENGKVQGSADRWNKAIIALAEKHPVNSTYRMEAILAKIDETPEAAAHELIDLLNADDNTFMMQPALTPEKILSVVDQLNAAGHPELAQKVLDKAIELKSSESALWNLKMKYQNTRMFDDLRIDGIQTIRDYLAENRNDPGNSVMILDYAATRIMPDGSKIGLTHQISRVLTKEGKNSVGEIYLPSGAAILKARTIKDGTFEAVDPEAIDFKESITAPNLAVGDYVETEYLTYDAPQSPVNSRAATDMFFFGADMVPLVRSEYVVEYPKEWNIDIVKSGPENEIDLNCAPRGEFMRCVAKRMNIPPFISQQGSDSAIDLIPNIQFYYLYDWEFIKRALSETITRQTRITPYVQRFYETIKMPETDSVWERARAIYNHVVDSIDESESFTTENETATSSVSRGTGSRMLVIKAMYDLAGIPSYMALVNPLGTPHNSDKLPVLYNSTHHLVLVAETEKGPAYIQPEEDFMPFDFLEPTSQNRNIIPIDLDRENFVSRTDDPEMDRSLITIEYDIDEEGKAQAKSNEVIKGARTVVMRDFLNKVKNDQDMMNQTIRNSLAANYGRINLTHFSYDHLNERNEPLTMDYRFDIAHFTDISDGNMNILTKIFAYNLINHYAAKSPSEQKNAVYVSDFKLSRRVLKFHAPAGYQWKTDTLQDVNIDTKFGKYTRHADPNGSDLEVVETIQVMPQRVDVKDYAEFRDFCRSVDEAQRTVLTAVK